MGLDMYLKRKSDNEEMIYLRKENQIHRWFDNLHQKRYGREIGDCEAFTITKEDLIDLSNICKKVLDSCEMETKQEINKFNGTTYEVRVVKNPTVAMELLPTTRGFFFGSTDYDECYVNGIKYTMEKVNELLREFDFENDSLEYMAWW